MYSLTQTPYQTRVNLVPSLSWTVGGRSSPKTPRQIRHPQAQHRLRQEIRPPANQLPLQIPAMHATRAQTYPLGRGEFPGGGGGGGGDGVGVAGAGYYVEVVKLLQPGGGWGSGQWGVGEYLCGERMLAHLMNSGMNFGCDIQRNDVNLISRCTFSIRPSSRHLATQTGHPHDD